MFEKNKNKNKGWIQFVKKFKCLTSREITWWITAIPFLSSFSSLQIPRCLVFKTLQKVPVASVLVAFCLNFRLKNISECFKHSYFYFCGQLNETSVLCSQSFIIMVEAEEGAKKCHLFGTMGFGHAYNCLIKSCNCNAVPYGLACKAQVLRMNLALAVLYCRTLWYGFLINQRLINGT